MLERSKTRLAVRAALLILAGLLIASVVLNYTLLRHLRLYGDGNPAASPFVSGKCNQPALVGHWRFDKTAEGGRVSPDDSGYGNNGRMEVARRLFSELRYGRAAQVPGVDGNALEVRGRQWLAAGNNDCFAVERFTVSAWVWLNEVGNVPTIVGKSSWPHNGWFLLTTTRGIQPEDRYLDLGILWPGGTAHVKSGYQLPLREWHHVVVTADNVKNEAQFFIDGKPLARHRDVPKWHVNWDHELVVGDYDGTTRWPWVGKLDDVRFYNYVLPEAEAVALYKPPSGR